MDIFFKMISISLITAILGLVLSKESKDIALLISITACVMIMWVGFSYLSGVLSFFDTLMDVTQIDSDMLTILLKATGVGILGEITALVCSDAGNGALGKAVQVTSSLVIMWIALPLFEGLLQLIESVMEGL